MCIINAYRLFNIHYPQVTHLQFRELLMDALIRDFVNNQEALRASRSPRVSVALAKAHYIEHSDQANDCHVCSVRPDNRKRTVKD